MKTLFLFAASVFSFSCVTRGPIQSEMVDASLVDVAIVSRYPNNKQKMLTWRTSNNITYVTFAPLSSALFPGNRVKAIIRK